MGAVTFPITQLPIPNLRFQEPRTSGAVDTPSEEVFVPPTNATESGAPSAVTTSDWGSYSLASIELSASRISAQSSDGGAHMMLQSSNIEANAYAATLRSDDGLIQFSLSSLTMRASQLSLSFASDQREQRVSEFMQRMNDLATQLGPPADSRLRVSAQALSIRFSHSATISETALNGFEKAANTLSGFNTTLFTRFLVLFRTLLASSDEEGSEFLEALEDFLEETFGLLTGESDHEADAAVRNALTSDVPQTSPDGNSETVQAFFEQIEMRYTRIEVSVENAQPNHADPLVLDLDGNGIELTDEENLHRFDVSGSGTPVLTAFPAGGDAFLAIDRNANGTIDSGKELFGDQHGAPNGFAELAKFDDNLDRIIDAKDGVYEQLLLFGDLDEDGEVRPNEFIPLQQAGISAIDLGYEQVVRPLPGGNRIAQSSQFIRDNGSTGTAADVILRTFSVLA